MIYRRAILLAFVLYCLSLLYGCGMTTENRMEDMRADLSSESMNARIAEARR